MTHGFDAIDWQHYPHQDMWNMIMAADPVAMFEEATKADDLATAMGDITIFLNRIAQNVVGAWSGPAAESAAAQIKRFLDWSDGTANTVTGVARLLSTYAHILNRAKLSIPVPDGSAGSRTHAQHVMENHSGHSVDPAILDRHHAVVDHHRADDVRRCRGRHSGTARRRGNGWHGRWPDPGSREHQRGRRAGCR